MGTAGRIALALAGAALLAALFFVFRPGGDDEQSAAATAREPAPAAADPETRPLAAGPATVAVRVRDGRVEGGVRHVEVEQGERVRLVVRADVADHVHLHGYDVVREVGPGRPAQLVFAARLPGRFEVELEDAGLPIAEIEVRP